MGGLPEWDFYTDTPGSVFHTLDIITPIVGMGSVLLSYFDTPIASINVMPTIASGYSTAVTIGRLRSLLYIKHFNGSSPTDITYVGLSAMQSARDITGTGASRFAYLLAIKMPEDLGTIDLQILKVKTASGLLNIGSAEVLATAVYPDPIIEGGTYALELQWILDIPELNGVFLVARTGLLTDYSDLTDRLSVVDYVNPLTTSLGEGLFAVFNGGSAVSKVFTFDNTTLYTLT
jgi:hypothetical protein